MGLNAPNIGAGKGSMAPGNPTAVSAAGFPAAVSYIKKHLMSGEVVAMETHLSGILYIPALIVTALAAALYWTLYRSGSAPSNAALLAAVPLVAAAVLALCALYKQNASEFAVTNKRVVVKTGMLHRRSTETMLRQVEGITVDQGIFARIFDYGTIVIEGTGSDRVPYSGIAHPQRFRLTVLEQIEKSLGPRAAPATGAADALEDSYDALVKITALKDRGTLTEEEFQREKRKILGQPSPQA
jgi:membrane protein YdbS with pleckstrin-like domain